MTAWTTIRETMFYSLPNLFNNFNVCDISKKIRASCGKNEKPENSSASIRPTGIRKTRKMDKKRWIVDGEAVEVVGIRELTLTIINEFVKKIIVHALDKFSVYHS